MRVLFLATIYLALRGSFFRYVFLGRLLYFFFPLHRSGQTSGIRNAITWHARGGGINHDLIFFPCSRSTGCGPVTPERAMRTWVPITTETCNIYSILTYCRFYLRSTIYTCTSFFLFTYFSSKVKIEVKTTELTQCGPLIITKPRFFQRPKSFGPTHMSTSITIAYRFAQYFRNGTAHRSQNIFWSRWTLIF